MAKIMETAEELYHVYNAAGENPWLNFKGEKCPEWKELPDNIKTKWRAVAIWIMENDIRRV